MKGRNTKWSDSEDRLLIEWYPNLSAKFLSKWMQRSECSIYNRVHFLDLSKSEYSQKVEFQRQAERLKRDGAAHRYSKGRIPENKGQKMSNETYEKVKRTMFKKGNVPANAKDQDGTITIRHENKSGYNPRAYKYIRVSIGNWMPYHRYVWELQNGTIPKGFNVQFKDNDSMNCEIDNLYLVARSEQSQHNKRGGVKLPHEIKQSITLINKLKQSVIKKQNKRSEQPSFCTA